MTSQWRLILREYIAKNPDEKRAIARKLEVSLRSIERWTADESTTAPDRSKVFKLSQMVPGKEQEMRLSLQRDYPEAFERPSGSEILSNIPSVFLLRNIGTLATTARKLARPTIMSSTMRQMAGHLDPDEEGILVLFAQCVKPVESDGKVGSLTIHTTGYGTERWRYQQVERSYMIGADTLSATAVNRGDIVLYPQDEPHIDYSKASLIIHGENIRSAAAYPVLREGDIAGALFVASAQVDFFTETRRELIKQYADSFALALRDNEFYPSSQIELQPMPTVVHQSVIFVESQQFLEGLAQQFPNDSVEQLEERARQIFFESLAIIKERESNAE